MCPPPPTPRGPLRFSIHIHCADVLYRLWPVNIWLCWSMFWKPFYSGGVFINLLCGALQPTPPAVGAGGFDRWRDVHCGASLACPLGDAPTLKRSNENAAKTLHRRRRWLWALVWDVSPLVSPRLIAAVLLLFVLLPAREPPFIPHSCFPSSPLFLFFFTFLHHELRACLGCWILIKWIREGLDCFSDSLCRLPPTPKEAKQVGKQWYWVTVVPALYFALLSLERSCPDPVLDGIPGAPTW